jgi:hypothetical protein
MKPQLVTENVAPKLPRMTSPARQRLKDLQDQRVDHQRRISEARSSYNRLRVANSGTTAQRPTSTSSPLASKPGVHFLDTTINKFIVFDGITWRDPATGSAV